MKILSWNVNGLRAVMGKGFSDIVTALDPDVLCLQEIKARPEQLKEPLPEGYHACWNPAVRKGYSGTLVLTRVEPLSVVRNLGIEKHDQEGRVLTLEYSDYFLVNVYTPNAQNELRRLDYRVGEWDADFRKCVMRLDKKKPVILCGDFNVAHQEIDIARPKENRGTAGFTDEERESFTRLLGAGFLDSFRTLHPDAKDAYSWWSFRAGARARNVGWRLDYFCLSERLRPELKEAFILQEVMGSDHAPVGIII